MVPGVEGETKSKRYRCISHNSVNSRVFLSIEPGSETKTINEKHTHTQKKKNTSAQQALRDLPACLHRKVLTRSHTHTHKKKCVHEECAPASCSPIRVLSRTSHFSLSPLSISLLQLNESSVKTTTHTPSHVASYLQITAQTHTYTHTLVCKMLFGTSAPLYHTVSLVRG